MVGIASQEETGLPTFAESGEKSRALTRGIAVHIPRVTLHPSSQCTQITSILDNARFSAVMWSISASKEPLDSHGTCYMICWWLLESH